MGLPLNSTDLEPHPRSLCVCESRFALGTSFIKNNTNATQAYPWVNPMEASRHQSFEVLSALICQVGREDWPSGYLSLSLASVEFIIAPNLLTFIY